MGIRKSNLGYHLGKVISGKTADKPKMTVISKNADTGAMNVALRQGGKMYTTQMYESVGRATTKVYTVTKLNNTEDTGG